MSTPAHAPKRAVFFTVLLVIVTLAQAGGILLILMAWRDRVDHGQAAGLQLAFLPLAVAALVAAVGLWFWQRWAVVLFAVVALVGFVSDAILGVSGVALLVRVALLAALFWQISEHRAAFRLGAAEQPPVEDNQLRG